MVKVEVSLSRTKAVAVELAPDFTSEQLISLALETAALPLALAARSLLSYGATQLQHGQQVWPELAQRAARLALTTFHGFGPKGPEAQPLWISATERRGITLAQLDDVVSFVEEHAECWCEMSTYVPPERQGRQLHPSSVNLYNLNDWLLKPATAGYRNPSKPTVTGCSWVELVAEEAQQQVPTWFVSHAWNEPIVRFVQCLRRHAAARELDSRLASYWICAYANNQHDLTADLAFDPRETSFFKALQLSVGLLLVLDQEATACSRIWCCFEISVALDPQYRRSQGWDQFLLDIATVDSSGEAQLLTSGLAGAERRMVPLLGLQAKSAREALFPLPVLCRGLSVDVAAAAATQAEDKRRILNTIAGNRDLESQPPAAHKGYDEVNRSLRATFALAGWSATIQKGVTCSSLGAALQEDQGRKFVGLSFLGEPNFGDAQLLHLVSSMPQDLRCLRLDLCLSSLEELRGLGVTLGKLSHLENLQLRFTGCQDLEDVQELAIGIQEMKKLKGLELWLSHCPRLRSADELVAAFRKHPVLERLVLSFAGCEQLDLQPETLLREVSRAYNFGQLSEFWLDLSGCSALPQRFQRLLCSNRPLDAAFVAMGLWSLRRCGAEPEAPLTEDLLVTCDVPSLFGRQGQQDEDRSEHGSSGALVKLRLSEATGAMSFEEALRAPFPCSQPFCPIFHSNLGGYCSHCVTQHAPRQLQLRRLRVAAETGQLLLVAAVMGALEVDSASLLALVVSTWLLAVTTSLVKLLGPVSLLGLAVLGVFFAVVRQTLRRIDGMECMAEAVEREVEVLLCKELSGSGPVTHELRMARLGPPSFSGPKVQRSGSVHASFAKARVLRPVVEAAVAEIASCCCGKLQRSACLQPEQPRLSSWWRRFGSSSSSFQSLRSASMSSSSSGSAATGSVSFELLEPGREEGVVPLRADIDCAGLPDLCNCWEALQRLVADSAGSWQIHRVSNGFREDAETPGGYRCVSVVLGPQEALLTVHFHVARLRQLHASVDWVYEVARKVGLLSGGERLGLPCSQGHTRSTWQCVVIRSFAQLVRVVACGVAAFFAFRYYTLYLPPGSRVAYDAAVLALPHATTALLLFHSFWKELKRRWCSPRHAPKRRRVGAIVALYRSYFGVLGRFYPVKMATTQAAEVVLQTTGKLGLLGAMVTQMEFLHKEWMAVVGFWSFLGLLLLNSIYPTLLFLKKVQLSPAMRAAACLLDAALGLGYMVTYLLTIMDVGAKLQWDSQIWDEARQVYLVSHRSLSRTMPFPVDFLGYLAIYWPAMRAFALCRSLESVGQTRLPLEKCSKMPTQARVFVAVLYPLVMLSFVAGTTWWQCQDRYPFQRPDACFPCRCSGAALVSCGVARALDHPVLELTRLNISSISDKALQHLERLEVLSLRENQLRQLFPSWFRGLPRLRTLDLSGNPFGHLPEGAFAGAPLLDSLFLTDSSLETLEPGAFRGLEGLRILNLQRSRVESLQPGAFEGLSHLMELWLEGNPVGDLTGCNTPRKLRDQPSCNFEHGLCGWSGRNRTDERGECGWGFQPWERLDDRVGIGISCNGTGAVLTLESPELTLPAPVTVAFELQFLMPGGTLSIDARAHGGDWHSLRKFSARRWRASNSSWQTVSAEVPQSVTQVRLAAMNPPSNPERLAGLLELRKVAFSRASNCASHLPALNQGTVAIQEALESNRSSRNCFPCLCDSSVALYQRNNIYMEQVQLRSCEMARNFGYTDLQLTDRSISVISPRAFQGLQKIGTLNLRNNALLYVEPGAFEDLPTLSRVLLDGNRFLNMLAQCSGEESGCTPGEAYSSGRIVQTWTSADCFPCRCSVTTSSLRRLEQCALPALLGGWLVNLTDLGIDEVSSSAFRVDSAISVLEEEAAPRIAKERVEDFLVRQYVNLTDNNLTHIEAGAFSSFNSTIDLSGNRLRLDRDLVWAFPTPDYGSRWSVGFSGNPDIPFNCPPPDPDDMHLGKCSRMWITVLQVLSTYDCFPCSCVSPSKDQVSLTACAVPAGLNFTTVDLRARGITAIEVGAFDQIISSSVQELLLEGNPVVSALQLPNNSNFMSIVLLLNKGVS